MNKFEMELNESAAKAFFFKHGEKILLGVGVAVMGTFAYFGLNLTPDTDLQPSTVKATVQQAESVIQRGSWEDMAKYRTVVEDAKAQFVANRGTVDPKLFASSEWSGVRRNSQSTRQDPMVATAEKPMVDLMVATTVVKSTLPEEEPHLLQKAPLADRGKLKIDENANIAIPGIDASDAGISGSLNKFMPKVAYFTSVRFVIPYQKMVEDFKAKLAASRSYDEALDAPVIGYLEIQRKTNGGKWEDISDKIKEQNKALVVWSPEFVDEESESQMVTNPIPPVLAEDYSSLAIHPDAGMRKDDAKDKKGAQTAGAGSIAQRGGDDKEEPAADPHKVPTYKLVRFADTSVQPGNKYQYRVRLWYFDSNNPRKIEKKDDGKKSAQAGNSSGKGGGGAPQMGMEDEGSAKSQTANSEEEMKKLESKVTINQIHESVRDRLRSQLDIARPKDYLIRFRPSDWSPETKEVNVSRVLGETVLATAGKNGTWKYSDPSKGVISGPRGDFVIKALAAQWDEKFGVRIPAVADEVAVGDLIVGEGHPTVWDPMSKKYRVVHNNQGIIYSKKKDLRNSSYVANSGQVLVDFIGGEELEGVSASRKDSFSTPIDALIVDSSGALKVQNSQTDKAKYIWMTGQVDLESKAKKPDSGTNNAGGGK